MRTSSVLSWIRMSICHLHIIFRVTITVRCKLFLLILFHDRGLFSFNWCLNDNIFKRGLLLSLYFGSLFESWFELMFLMLNAFILLVVLINGKLLQDFYRSRDLYSFHRLKVFFIFILTFIWIPFLLDVSLWEKPNNS